MNPQPPARERSLCELRTGLHPPGEEGREEVKGNALATKAKEILALLQLDPFASPPPYEALAGNLKGAYSRRINIQRRVFYEVLKDERLVKVIRLWTHYE